MIETAALLLVALLLDAVFGEPRFLWDKLPHPAVLMGRAVGACDHYLNRGNHRKLKGFLTISGLVFLSGGLAQVAASLQLGQIVEVLGAAVLLAQRSLVDHVGAVARALRISLSEGRRAVSMIVGRDTSELDEHAVARAAIESAAENLSDGVIAPAFWFLVAGLPGIVIYKIVNTADSMIGHRTERYEAFGWAAARLDDLLNYVPARLTALLIATGHGRAAWRAARRDGPKHRSVNAGWPEAAMARALGLALSGPRSYSGSTTTDPILNPAGSRDGQPADIAAAVSVLWQVWRHLAAALVLVIVTIAAI